MRTSETVFKEIASIRQKVNSIIECCEREARDPTAEESTFIELAVGVDGEGGQLKDLQTELGSAQKLDDLKTRAAKRFAEVLGVGGEAPTWNRDSRGRGFAILNRNDKAADILKAPVKAAAGHFIVAKLFGCNRHTPEGIKAVLSTSDNSLGGFMVPERLSGEVIDLARARSVLMQAGTRTVLMDSDNLTIPKIEGDATVATKSENSAFTASNVTLGARRLETKTAGCLVKLSRELAEDAPTLVAEQLTNAMGAALATKVDYWGIQGVGAGVPQGLLSYATIDSTGSIGAIDWLDLASAVSSIRNANHEPNACILNTEIYSDLFTSQTGDGTNAARGWLSAPPTLSNVNFLPTTNCPQTKLICGDFTKYMMGVRTAAMVEMTTDGEAFEKHQVWVKVTQRIDFVTLDDDAFYILTGITS